MGATCSRPKFSMGKLSRTEQLRDVIDESSHERPSEKRVFKTTNDRHQLGCSELSNSVPKDNSKFMESTTVCIQTEWLDKIDENCTVAALNTQKGTADLCIKGSDIISEVNERRDTRSSLNNKSDNEDIKNINESDTNIETALDFFRIKANDDITYDNGGSKSLSKDEIIATSKLVVQRVTKANREVAVSTWKETNGEYTQSAKQLLHVLDEAYGFLISLKVPIEYVIENRKSVANMALNTDIIEQICEIVTEIYQGHLVPDWNTSGLWTPLYLSLSILWNYTDTSEEWTERVANAREFLNTIHKILTDMSTMETTTHTEEEKWVLLAALGITHNLSMVDANIAALREKNFTKALQPHLKSSNKDEHLAALSSLAGIINEEESEIINSNKKVVKHLMRVLKRGLTTAERRYGGWTCKESALTITMLGRNDANKRLLVRLGALPLLVQLAKGNTAEQTEAMNAIWVLSFDAANQKVMVHTDDLEVIETVCDLTQGANEKIRKASNGTLWNLREELRTSENQKYQDIGTQIMPVAESSIKAETYARSKQIRTDTCGEGHIMISYQWSNQKTLIGIRNELHKHGLKVWMDVDNMAGSTLQAMAEAIENADIVLLCYSQKYKISPNCRAEAEYSFLRQKNIIPLRMERDYKPDGWLGILLGTKLFFDFSGKYEFKEKFNKLLVEVTRMKGELRNPLVPKAMEPLYHHSDTPDGAVIQTHQEVQAPPTTHMTDPVHSVKSWTNDDIQNWIIKQNLPKQPFCKFTVDEIVLLLNMRREAPESFYTYLDKLLKSNFRVIAQVVRALEEIGKK